MSGSLNQPRRVPPRRRRQRRRYSPRHRQDSRKEGAPGLGKKFLDVSERGEPSPAASAGRISIFFISLGATSRYDSRVGA